MASATNQTKGAQFTEIEIRRSVDERAVRPDGVAKNGNRRTSGRRLGISQNTRAHYMNKIRALIPSRGQTGAPVGCRFGASVHRERFGFHSRSAGRTLKVGDRETPGLQTPDQRRSGREATARSRASGIVEFTNADASNLTNNSGRQGFAPGVADSLAFAAKMAAVQVGKISCTLQSSAFRFCKMHDPVPAPIGKIRCFPWPDATPPNWHETSLGELSAGKFNLNSVFLPGTSRRDTCASNQLHLFMHYDGSVREHDQGHGDWLAAWALCPANTRVQ